MESALDILARAEQSDVFLKDSRNEQHAAAVRAYLESVRLSQGMDILNLLDADGKVLLRTRPRTTTTILSTTIMSFASR